ncbi:MAG: hypothetical protein PHI22_02435 [Bacilli bacterium]|nr:hypothetical protein [Bacilli bacterium]
MKKLKPSYVEPEKEIKIIKIQDDAKTKDIFNPLFIDSIGDIEVDEFSYHSLLDFIKEKSIYDKYSVLYLIDFIRKLPTITRDGIDRITSIYATDIFKGKAVSQWISLLEQQGLDDINFGKFLLKVEKYYLAYIEYLKQDLVQVDRLLSEYPKMYVDDVKEYMRSDKILLNRILPYIPSISLVDKDIEHLMELARYYRIHFDIGECGCITVLKTASSEGKSIDETTFDGVSWRYHVRSSGSDKYIPFTFTKEDYIESVKSTSLSKAPLKRHSKSCC